MDDRISSALWWIGPGGAPALPNLLDIARSDKQPDSSRLAALHAAVKIKPSVATEPAALATIPLLIRLLDKGRFMEQGEAAEVLKAIGPPAHDALPFLQERLKLPGKEVDSQGSEYVRMEAKEAIAAIEGTSAAKPNR